MTIGDKKFTLFAGGGRSCWNIMRKQIIVIPTIVLLKNLGDDDDIKYAVNVTWLLWGFYVGVKVREV